MKMVESNDGTIKVIELDPTKRHWIIADVDAMPGDSWRHVTLERDQILLKRPQTQITVVEGDAMPAGMTVQFPEGSD